MKIERVSSPVRGQTEAYLRSAIEKGDLRPGDRIVEREICEALGVSRPLVREAMRALEADGLTAPTPRGGMTVATLSREEAMHVYVVRRELEGLAAILFSQNADAPLRAQLQEAVTRLVFAAQQDDAGGALAAKNDFYASLWLGSANPVLLAMLKNIHGRIRLLRGLSLSVPGRQRAMVEELQAIAAALDAGDGAEARRRTEEHVENAMQATAAAFESLPDRSSSEAAE